MRCCSAAVPSAVSLNSASTSASSWSACSTPRRAIVQKSAELLVTNATLSVFGSRSVPLSRDWHAAAAIMAAPTTHAATHRTARPFMQGSLPHPAA